VRPRSVASGAPSARPIAAAAKAGEPGLPVRNYAAMVDSISNVSPGAITLGCIVEGK